MKDAESVRLVLSVGIPRFEPGAALPAELNVSVGHNGLAHSASAANKCCRRHSLIVGRSGRISHLPKLPFLKPHRIVHSPSLSVGPPSLPARLLFGPVTGTDPPPAGRVAAARAARPRDGS